MSIKVYNTLTKQKEEFVPIHPGKANIYVCGVIPQNLPHGGNARQCVTCDVSRRFLEHEGYDVTHVQNFTDVDDKIINTANKEGVQWYDICNRYIDSYFEVMDKLNVRRAHVYPRVSEHIDDIIKTVQCLIDNGYGYVVDGDVFYSVEKFKYYGQLSGRNIEDMMAGARVDVDDRKHNPMDFALWNSAIPCEPAWESPWGPGRPGWHIECSVMSKKYLGEQIDIHAGGEDLIFPHHENVIAQSDAANGKEFARYWMHNAFLNIDNRKMSKSLGNFRTVREISEQYDLQVLRFFMLSAHYRSPINFSREIMESSKNALERIVTAVSNLTHLAQEAAVDVLSAKEEKLLAEIPVYRKKFEDAMDDDLNTADAISAIFELVKFANTNGNDASSGAFVTALKKEIVALSDVLGLQVEKEEENLDGEIEKMIEERQAARKASDFKRAAEIRDELLAQGIILEDTREGVKWKRA